MKKPFCIAKTYAFTIYTQTRILEDELIDQLLDGKQYVIARLKLTFGENFRYDKHCRSMLILWANTPSMMDKFILDDADVEQLTNEYNMLKSKTI